MNDRLLAGPVVELIAETEYRIVDHKVSGWRITDSESELWIRRVSPEGAREEDFEIEDVQRGASNGLALKTPLWTVVEHYVVHEIGHIWRNDHGMGMLPTTDVPRGRASAYQAVMEQPRLYGVRDVDADRWIAHELQDVSARELVVSLPFTIEDVIASYRNPQGAPVFRATHWWRRY